jgi:hypothetical protein
VWSGGLVFFYKTQYQTCVHGEPREQVVGPRDDPRRVRDVFERIRERRPLGGCGQRSTQDGQPVGRDARRLWIRLKDHHGEVSRPQAGGRTIC